MQYGVYRSDLDEMDQDGIDVAKRRATFHIEAELLLHVATKRNLPNKSTYQRANHTNVIL